MELKPEKSELSIENLFFIIPDMSIEGIWKLSDVSISSAVDANFLERFDNLAFLRDNPKRPRENLCKKKKKKKIVIFFVKKAWENFSSDKQQTNNNRKRRKKNKIEESRKENVLRIVKKLKVENVP